ncbi:MAG: hypothetical protein H8E27_11475 [Verrucomicrobia subdivision 3 bacterium]|nr:hypothetical protein [Limisphaerales bacterium]
MKTNLTLILVAFCLIIGSVSYATEDVPAPSKPPKAYVGKMPDNDKLKVLVEHKAIATFQDVKFHTCRGSTGSCPDRCGSSGEYANFEITDYLHYQKIGKGDKQRTYSVHVTDFHRKPIGDLVLGAYIKTLKTGDQVVIEWKHLYGAVAPGVSGPVRSLLLLKKIDKAEATRLIEAKAIAQRTEEDRRKRGLHLTQGAFLKRLRTLDPKQFSKTKAKEFAKLTQLRLNDLTLTDDDFLCLVKWMPALENLHLWSCDFPKPSLEHLTGLKDLTKLSLQFCSLGNESMGTLSKLKALTSLNLMGNSNGFTDEGLEALARLEHLEHLDLEGISLIKGPGLQHLVKLKHLSELDLGQISRGGGIRDEGFDNLAKMTALKKLSLRYCEEFSPESLDKLTGLKNLEVIDFSDAFTYRDDKKGIRPALASLQKALPDCKLLVSKRFENEK